MRFSFTICSSCVCVERPTTLAVGLPFSVFSTSKVGSLHLAPAASTVRLTIEWRSERKKKKRCNRCAQRRAKEALHFFQYERANTQKAYHFPLECISQNIRWKQYKERKKLNAVSNRHEPNPVSGRCVHG